MWKRIDWKKTVPALCLLGLLAYWFYLQRTQSEGARGRDAAQPSADAQRAGWYRSERAEQATESVPQVELGNSPATVSVRVTYPKPDHLADPPRPRPVIVFSHGLGRSQHHYRVLTSYWAEHGYVCIQPTHGDSISRLSRQELRQFNSLADYYRSGVARQYQLVRASDIRQILDRLDEIENQNPDLQGRLDSERIGVAGHALGAHTTGLVGGMTLRNDAQTNGRRISKADTRPRALVMISPHGMGGQIDELSWDEMTRPTLLVTGGNDVGAEGNAYPWRLDPFNLMKCPRYLLFIEEANHSFGGIEGGRRARTLSRNATHVDYVKRVSLAFWDAYLRDDQAARQYLHSDQLEVATGTMVRIEHRSAETP